MLGQANCSPSSPWTVFLLSDVTDMHDQQEAVDKSKEKLERFVCSLQLEEEEKEFLMQETVGLGRKAAICSLMFFLNDREIHVLYSAPSLNYEIKSVK